MSIVTRKKGDKRYSYSISTGKKKADGQYEYITGPYYATKKEAKEAEAQITAQLQLGTYVAPSKITVNELLEKFIATKVDLRPSSITALNSFAKRVQSQPLGEMQITTVSLLDVEAYRVWLIKESGLAPQTIRESLSFVRSAFAWAVDGDLLLKNPARTIKLPPKQKPKGMHVPIEILMNILGMIKRYDYGNLYMPFLLGGMCGMRISETLAVKADIIREDVAQVEHNLQRLDGIMQFTPTKTPTSTRDIPLLGFVRDEIKEYSRFIASCKKEALARRELLRRTPGFIEEGSDPAWNNNLGVLIVFPDDGRPMCRDHVERRWRKFKTSCPEWLQLVEKYPLLTNMRHHDFRHSFGSNMRDRGVSIADISEILGHSSISFTASTYALPLENTHQKAMQYYEESIKNLLNL